MALGHETPFFFERRQAWVDEYDKHANACVGLRGLYSASVELFPHQAVAVRRVLQDPLVRYLLADEVGLGKTIEAGAILRQIHLDVPGTKSLILVPNLLCGQWAEELSSRYQLTHVTIAAHERLRRLVGQRFDVLVVDEAHLFLADSKDGADFERLRTLCLATPKLLLLSATPILHRDRQVLALLHLLDPDQYGLDDLQAFQKRKARRIPIGRLLLGLERASSPLLIRRQLTRLAAELAEDQELQELVEQAPDSTHSEHRERWRRLAARARILVGETWRLHRRLIRTRRSALLTEGELRRLRQVDEFEAVHTYADAPQKIPSLWAAIEELRASAAAHATHLPGSAEKLRRDYLTLAQTAATFGPRFVRTLAAVQQDPDWSFAADRIAQVEELASEKLAAARLEALDAILDSAPDSESRWVVFCHDHPEAAWVAGLLESSSPSSTILLLTEANAQRSSSVLNDLAAADERTYLVVDRSAEAGLNLQTADGLVLFDLPFHPMRLEQRIGRLDRIDRTRPLRAIAVLSIDDADGERTAFDRAWYELVVHGFGLFDESIADVPFLLERKMAHFGTLAFERGPAAFYEEVDALREELDKERTEAAELAIVDGTSISRVRSAAWWTGLEDEDADEDSLGDAFRGYVGQSLRIHVRRGDEAPAKSFRLQRDPRRDILLPVERLEQLSRLSQARYTFSRRLATQHADLCLLRPGAPLLDWLRELADWDDRGRAFALWRRSPGFPDPCIVIRVAVVAQLDTDAVAGLDDAATLALSRLAAMWFAPRRQEVFLQIDGKLAELAQVEACRPPYDKRRDTNLSGERVSSLLRIVSADQWSAMCRDSGDTAIRLARESSEFRAHARQASQDANLWFSRQQTRLALRARHDLDGGDTHEEVQRLRTQEQLVEAMMAHPHFSIDSIGVYVLSELLP